MASTSTNGADSNTETDHSSQLVASEVSTARATSNAPGGYRDTEVLQGGDVAAYGPLAHAEFGGELFGAQTGSLLDPLEEREHPTSGGRLP